MNERGTIEEDVNKVMHEIAAGTHAP